MRLRQLYPMVRQFMRAGDIYQTLHNACSVQLLRWQVIQISPPMRPYFRACARRTLLCVGRGKVGHSRDVVGDRLLLVGRECNGRVRHGRVRQTTRGEAAKLREEVAVTLSSDRRNRVTFAAASIASMTAGAPPRVVPLPKGQCPTFAVLRVRVVRRAREIGGEIPERRCTVQVRRLERVVHDRAMHLGTLACAVDKVRQLLNQIALLLPRQDGDFSRPIPPRVSAVARGAVLQIQDHAVPQIGRNGRCLRNQVLVSTGCRTQRQRQSGAH